MHNTLFTKATQQTSHTLLQHHSHTVAQSHIFCFAKVAVFIEDEFKKEKVKNNDEETDGCPE